MLDIERGIIHLRQGDTLDREIRGQVAFVMHLNELRQRLNRDRRRLASGYEGLKKAIPPAMNQDGGGPVKESLALYQLQRESQERYAALEEKRQALDTRIGHLKEWTSLLNDTDRLFNALARLPDLREQLTRQIVPEIQAHLTKRKLDGLGDWELFRAKVDAVEEELDKRRRHGNERFSEVKETYEQFLREMNVSDYRPRTRYTYGEDEDSYRDLYQEVCAKIENRLAEITDDLERENTDLLKAKHIFVSDKKLVSQIEKQLADVQKSLKQLRRALTISLIQKAGDELTVFSQRVNDAEQSVATIRQQLGPVLFADHQLTPEEANVLEAFGARNDIDLTDLFVGLRHTGQKIEQKELLTILEGLYRKNRVIIRVRRRG